MDAWRKALDEYVEAYEAYQAAQRGKFVRNFNGGEYVVSQEDIEAKRQAWSDATDRLHNIEAKILPPDERTY